MICVPHEGFEPSHPQILEPKSSASANSASGAKLNASHSESSVGGRAQWLDCPALPEYESGASECHVEGDSFIKHHDLNFMMLHESGRSRPVVLKMGVEPTCPCEHLALNQARIPFRHLSAALPGFEPRMTDSESVVLPLHYRALIFKKFPEEAPATGVEPA